MTKSDIKDYMIVETGYDDCKYLVMKFEYHVISYTSKTEWYRYKVSV